jgi:hypothetical protein
VDYTIDNRAIYLTTLLPFTVYVNSENRQTKRREKRIPYVLHDKKKKASVNVSFMMHPFRCINWQTYIATQRTASSIQNGRKLHAAPQRIFIFNGLFLCRFSGLSTNQNISTRFLVNP